MAETTGTPAEHGAANREPNWKLSAIRQAARLTQHQLAEAVSHAHWQLFEREAAIDADYISKAERGLITWPNKHYREAFRTALGATTDTDLGFYSRRSHSRRPADTVDAERLTDCSQEVRDVRRSEFIRLITGLGASASLGTGALLPDPAREMLALAANPTPIGQVGHREIEQIHYAITTFRSWRDRYGGAACRDTLAQQVRWATGLLTGRAETTTRRELHSAVGYLADMAAWGDVDAGHHETALDFFQLALHCAEQARDWALRAEIFNDMAMQASYRDQVDEALTLIELGMVRADRVSGTSRAMLSNSHACILGAAGRASDCRAAVAAAEDHFAGHQPAGSSFGSYFQQASEADLALDNGCALFRAGLHDPAAAPAAVSQLRTALSYPENFGNLRRALSIVSLSTLELLHGDRDEGLSLAHQAVDVSDGMNSTVLADRLRQLRQTTTGHTGEPIHALQEKLDLIIVAA